MSKYSFEFKKKVVKAYLTIYFFRRELHILRKQGICGHRMHIRKQGIAISRHLFAACWGTPQSP